MVQLEEILIDLLLLTCEVIFYRTEVFECSQAHDAVELAEGLDGDILPILYVRLETVPSTRLGVFGRQGQADAMPASFLCGPQHGSPPAAYIEHPEAREEIQRVEHVVVLVLLCLGQGLAEVAVIHGAGDVSGLAEAQPEDLIH